MQPLRARACCAFFAFVCVCVCVCVCLQVNNVAEDDALGVGEAVALREGP